MTMPRRFVALGDSFTEGVGDVDRRLPNNCRGWADRVAEDFARHDDRTLYANLAVRGRRLQRIVDEQLEPALALNPTLISFYAAWQRPPHGPAQPGLTMRITKMP